MMASDRRTKSSHGSDSKLRQVPDNQEVWIDKDGFTSIIFDITERVGGPGSGPEIDGRAMTTHLEDMVGSDIDTVKIWNTAETEFTRLEFVPPPPGAVPPRRHVAGPYLDPHCALTADASASPGLNRRHTHLSRPRRPKSASRATRPPRPTSPPSS